MPGMGMPGMGMPGMGMPGMPGMPGGGNMADMMNNPMVQQMMQNPEMIKMAQSMMGGGGMDPSKMDPTKMQEMFSKDPNMKKMMSDPDFLSNTLNMLKSPMGRPQVEQMASQMNMSADTLLTMLTWLLKIYMFYRRIVSNAIVFYGLIVLILSYILYWLGFTKDLLFMMPFR